MKKIFILILLLYSLLSPAQQMFFNYQVAASSGIQPPDILGLVSWYSAEDYNAEEILEAIGIKLESFND